MVRMQLMMIPCWEQSLQLNGKDVTINWVYACSLERLLDDFQFEFPVIASRLHRQE